MRKISEKGIGLITQWEGFKNTLYKDSAGLPTIGVGHLLTRSELTSGKIVIDGVRVPYHAGLSDHQVRALLAQDLEDSERCVNGSVHAALNQDQFDCLVSFCFNVGNSAFSASTLLKMLNNGQYDEVPNQLKRWVRSGNKVSKGLKNRRSNETQLWLGLI